MGGSSNNVVYTGNLGDFTEKQKVQQSFMEISTRLLWRNLIGKSDMITDGLIRHVEYDAFQERKLITNGELMTQQRSQEFNKTDFYVAIAFELSFLHLF